MLRYVHVRQIIDSHNQPHSLDLWDFALAVNLTGSFNLTRLALKHLVTVAPEEGTDGERGMIIFVASSAAVRSPFPSPSSDISFAHVF